MVDKGISKITGIDLNMVSKIKQYWDSRPLGKQYVRDKNIQVGSPEFFEHIRPWMGPFKFPWIKDRIEREAKILKGKHLLEIGCGMGFDSLEFIRRGVRVTATDLSTTAVDLAKKHFEIEEVKAEDVKVENVLNLSYGDSTFDAVWSRGVLHHTGNTKKSLQEIRRVLKPGGRAIISHFYRRPSWMYWISLLGRENIEYKEKDPPATNFYSEKEILKFFEGFIIESTSREHYRALPIARYGLKATLYRKVFRPIYNLIPNFIAERFSYKFSVTAMKL